MNVEGGPLLDALVDAVVVSDGAGRVVHINPAGEALLGWLASDLRGKPLEIVLPARLRTLGGGPFFAALAQRAVQLDGRAARGPALRRDGTEVVVDLTASRVGQEGLVVTLRPVLSPVMLDGGGVPEEVATEGSGSDRHRLDGRDASYRLIFEHAPVGMLHFDRRGTVTAGNLVAMQILGTSRRAFVGLNLLELPDPAIADCVRSTLSGQRARYEGDYRATPHSKGVPVRVDFTPLLGTGNIVLGGIGLVEDVTERKAMQSRLQQADRMASVGTLAAGVAHEINNPLAYVSASLDMAARKVAGLRGAQRGPAYEAVLGQIAGALAHASEGTERVSVIVRDLKTFSHADDERRVLVDVERVLDSTINLAWNEIKHRAQLVKDYGRVSAAWGDESRLAQVFLNLLVNAAQAIPEGHPSKHEIRVSTRDLDRGRVAVEIRDSGSGIPPELVGRVFEPFVTTKPIGVGTGLGLSISHGIVTALGGEITVESEMGKGSLFRVVLPGRHRRHSTPGLGAAARVATPRSRILIVEDEPMVARALRVELQNRHEVVVARGGDEALELLLNDDRFDMVLCDLSMPQPDGVSIYERLRGERPGVHERFVFMSGGAYTERTRKFLAEVPNPRLEKPFRIAQVETHLRQRRP
jgi:PAS domain S-box-containing protein